MKRGQLRNWAKWICTVPAVLTVSAAVASGFFTVGYSVQSPAQPATRTVMVGRGTIIVFAVSQATRVLPGQLGGQWIRLRGWNWGSHNERSLPFASDWRVGVLWNRERADQMWWVGMSLLYPVLLTAIPAAIVWYADRRRFGAGHCAKCGYKRAGLTAAAKCPECGTVPQSPP